MSLDLDWSKDYPNVIYQIDVATLYEIIDPFSDISLPSELSNLTGVFTPAQIINGRKLSRKELARIFTSLIPWEATIPDDAGTLASTGNHDPPNVLPKKVFWALFFLPRKMIYKYLRLSLRKSDIPEAGLGIIAYDKIPKGATASYLGIHVPENDANMYYSWEVLPYNPLSGELEEEAPIYYRDCSDPEVGNWTRFVNCGLKNKYNNLEQKQKFNTIYYETIRNINPGEELFVDYGPDYRSYNFKWKGKYY